MRLLMYSQDGMGLGHLRRTRNIARELLAREPRCEVRALVDAPDAPFFPKLRGMDFVKLPTIVKTGRGWTAPASDVERVVARRSRLVLEAFRDFAPDAVLIDHMPVGARGELKPMLDEPGDARFFLSLRDVLDRPEVTREAWSDVGAYDYLPRYDTVLVHGCADIYDADAAYGLSTRARRLVYNHYVAPAPAAGAASAASDDEPFVLVTGGGGADAFPLASTFLAALPLVRRALPLRALVLTGPNMAWEERAQLAQAAPDGVELLVSAPDATALLRRASAVVTMGGYNTLCEVLAWRKPALVVPRAGPSAEQRIRSRLFAERRLVRTIDPDALTPEALAQGLIALLTEDALPDEANVPPLDGAARAAGLLLERLGAREETATGASRP